MPDHTTPSAHLPSVASIYAARAAAAPPPREPWKHPLCQPLPGLRRGSFLPLNDGSLLCADSQGLAISHDDGATWSETRPAAHGQNAREPAACALRETAPGHWVMVFLDMLSPRRRFGWNDQTGEPDAASCCELHAIRSLDGGRTWSDRQVLLDGYNANFFGFIRTAAGRLVLVAEHLVTRPGRWVSCSLVSDDEGVTWQRSNLIDLGGHGHHDGATEPTVAELGDGRLLMLIRTNLGCFWQAFSEDGGRYWRTIGRSTLDASSSPGQLVRLQSGRLLLVWNRRDPEDGTWPASTQGPQFSEWPASWHREELSAAFSEDDGAHWSRPVVIARLMGGQLSYPQVFERRPGEIWMLPGFASRKWFNEDPVPFAVRFAEQDLRQLPAGEPRPVNANRNGLPARNKFGKVRPA